MNKLLVVSTRFISDYTSGADTRLINQLKGISENYEVYILHIINSNKPKLFFDIKNFSFVKDVFTVKKETRLLRKLFSKVTFLPPFAERRAWTNELIRVINNLNPDIIQCDLFLPAFFLPKKYRYNSIAYAQDSLIRYSYSEYMNSNNLFYKIKSYIKYLRYIEYEKVYKGFKKVIFVSKSDSIFNHLRNISVINLIVDIEQYEKPPKNKKIIFHGNLSYKPNVDSICWFIENVLKGLVIKHKNIELIIAGSKASNKLKKYFKKFSNINFIDTPNDIFREIKKARLVVQPIIWGSGQKNKILEAIACGRAVLCSKHAIEGTNILNNKHVLVCNSAQEYLVNIDSLFQNEKLYINLSTSAFNYVKKNFSSKNICKNYLKVLNEIKN